MKINYFEKGYIDNKSYINIIKDFKLIIKSGKFSSGKYVEKLEHKFKKYYKVKYAIAVNSGTSALHLSFLALNLKRNSKIITTSSSFIASTASIIYANLSPKFIDIKMDDFLIDIDSNINRFKNISGILPVSLYGKPINIPEVRKKIKFKTKIIVDSSQSHGSKINGGFRDTLGDINTFSFYPTKTLGSYGEGGMIITNNKEYYEKLISLRNWGNNKFNQWNEHAYNYRMDELQAAVIFNKIKYLDKEIELKNNIATIYNKFFEKKGIKTQIIDKKMTSCYYIYPILLKKRNKVRQLLSEYGIQTGLHYFIPIHKSKAYRKFKFSNIKLKNSEYLSKHELSLPISSSLSMEKINYILKTFDKIL